MATARHARMILSGSIISGPFTGEIWQTGISMVEGDAGGVFPGAIKEGLPSFEALVIGEATETPDFRIDWAWKGQSKLTQANQTALALKAVDLWTALKPNVPPSTRLDTVKISAFDEFGKTIGGANVFDLKTAPAGTGSTTTYFPPQVAVVASLRTGARGPGGRGRMYLPLWTINGTTGLLGSTTPANVANAVANLCEDIHGIGPVAAVVNAAPLTYSGIARVEVGNMYDIQRRRRNAINETYTSATVAV